MNNNQTNTQLLISVVMTIIFPLMGIISLYYAITAINQCKRNDESYALTLNKAYQWALYTGIAVITSSVGMALLLIYLYASN